MLTKGDLLAIQKMFDSSKKETNKRFDAVDERFDAVDTQIGQLSNRLDANTKDLTDLILAGFSTHEPILSNHEQRITRLDEVVFKTN